MNFTLFKNLKKSNILKHINWEQLNSSIRQPAKINTNNSELAKRQSMAIVATDAPSKKLEDIKRHNRFTLLRLDLDDVEITQTEIINRLLALGLYSFAIHTTANHKQKHKGSRYRIYIELAHGITLDEWCLTQTYLAYSMEADDCSNRPQQVMYLPIRFDGDHYEYHINQGTPLHLRGSQLLDKAIAFDRAQKSQLEVLQQEKANHVKPPFKEMLINGQLSVIDAVNKSYEWDSLLRDYGYTRQRRAWLPPESTSKTAGAYLLAGSDGKVRYYSHHASDPCAIGKCLDKFDFICIRSFNGDAIRAVRQMSSELFPEIDAHNKKLYVAHVQTNQLNSIKGEQ